MGFANKYHKDIIQETYKKEPTKKKFCLKIQVKHVLKS